ncbi:MAG: hypothetical protein ACRDHP_19470 [Ktedonobacterales bacterium]
MKHARIGGMLAALALTSLLFGACGATAATAATTSQSSAAGKEYSALMNAFRSANLTVYDGQAAATEQFVSVPGKKVFIAGQALEVYQYASASAATHDSHNIDADACLIHMIGGGTKMVNWDEPPHLYKKDQLLVIYVGSDYDIINVLVAQLGPQFAGV